MNSNYSPVIVIVAYNRVHTLQRILSSVNRAVCPQGTKLIISIDNNGENQEVASIANKYNWKYGERRLFIRKSV